MMDGSLTELKQLTFFNCFWRRFKRHFHFLIVVVIACYIIVQTLQRMDDDTMW